MITDPVFYLLAIPAVILFGISKGGFGGGLGVVAVPLMSLAISPVQAAAILLPILCFMDLMSLRAYWRGWIRSELIILVPGALVGILVGALMFRFLSDHLVKLIVGVVALTFTLHHVLVAGRRAAKTLWPAWAGRIAGTVAGFTSFVAHAGGPPVNMYLLRRPLNKTDFVATTVFFFTVVNYTKLIPYAWLGQFDSTNLLTSLTLAPAAAVGVLSGVWLHKRASERLFYSLVYILLFVVGVKLTADGLSAIG